jgi:aldehyde dehydrogenase (NAD+)
LTRIKKKLKILLDHLYFEIYYPTSIFNMKSSTQTSQNFTETLGFQKQTALAWRSSSTKERIDRLKVLKKWILSHRKEIQESLFKDFMKPPIETDLSEIYPVTTEIQHTIKNLSKWRKAKKISSTWPMLGTKGHIIKEPIGCSLIISPWNYPFNLAIGPLVSALAAGCPVILKPSELTPHTSDLIERMISELFDPSEVKVFLGNAEVAQELLSLPFDHIFFTGSPRIGKIIMEKAAIHLAALTLELGGKSPTLVTDTADLSDAAKKIVFGKLINCGQTCVAPDYILVHHTVKDHLIAELKIAIQEMYDPRFEGIEKSPDLAKIINKGHFDRINSILLDAFEKGAKIEFGGKSNEKTLFFEPTLLSQIKEDMEIASEEIFGPVLPIISYKSLSEAIDYINRKPKPLALYIFDSGSQSQEVLEKTSSGNVVINDCALHFLHSNLPFGGIGNSGLGKAHGYYGFLAFSHEKGILKQRVGLNNAILLRPPYGLKAKKMIDSLIKWF